MKLKLCYLALLSSCVQMFALDKIDNISSFAKIYGIVRYYSPNPYTQARQYSHLPLKLRVPSAEREKLPRGQTLEHNMHWMQRSSSRCSSLLLVIVKCASCTIGCAALAIATEARDTPMIFNAFLLSIDSKITIFLKYRRNEPIRPM